MPVGAVAAGGADAVAVRVVFLRVLMMVVGGAVGAGLDGRRMDGFGLCVEAEERGDVVAAAGPEAGLFGAEGGVWIGFAFGCEGLLLLG